MSYGPEHSRQVATLWATAAGMLCMGGCQSVHRPAPPTLVLADPGEYERQRAEAIRQYGSVDEAVAAGAIRGDQCGANGPLIEVLAPDLTKTLNPGFPIDVRWHSPLSDTHVVPEKTRISYKLLIWTDVTDRIRDYLKSSPDAVLDEHGLRIPSSRFPGPGSHRLRVTVFDSKDNCTVQDMTLHVAG